MYAKGEKMSNHIGEEYFCPVCKGLFTATKGLLDEIDLVHESKEQITVTILECSSCGSMSLPEGMNQIAWLIKGTEL